jgi:hypothetical protein
MKEGVPQKVFNFFYPYIDILNPKSIIFTLKSRPPRLLALYFSSISTLSGFKSL